MSDSETAAAQDDQLNPLVRMSITRIDLTDVARPGELLLDVTEPQGTAVFRAVAWAEQRGHDRLAAAVTRVFDIPPPSAGFALLINRSSSMLVFMTWPWAPAHRREFHPDMLRSSA